MYYVYLRTLGCYSLYLVVYRVPKVGRCTYIEESRGTYALYWKAPEPSPHSKVPNFNCG